MIRRTKPSGTHYYFLTSERREIPLGKDLDAAKRRYKELAQPDDLGMPISPRFLSGLVKQTKKRAARMGLPFDLTDEFVRRLFESQDGKCACSGIRFASNVYPGQRIRPWIPSIDRIVPGAGYVQTNVRLIGAAANIAINQFGDEIFYRLATGVLLTSRKLRTENAEADRNPAL